MLIVCNRYHLIFDESFDREVLRRLLAEFLRATKRRRDRRLAFELEETLLADNRPPRPQRKTIRRLARWCKTSGIYASGGVVGREISRLLFAEVLDREALGV